MNGDTIPVFAREAGPEFFHDRYTIALWWWELGEPPGGVGARHSTSVDEVWVAVGPHPAMRCPPRHPRRSSRSRCPSSCRRSQRFDRGALGLPEGFLFLFVFDYHSTAARKNPVGVIEAFRQRLRAGLRSLARPSRRSTTENLPHEHQRAPLAAAGHPDIHLARRYVWAGEKNAMVASCDCYVSLHRSEGFGLTPAEAMYLGRPVIATAYGGVIDFMTAHNSYLVGHRLAQVGRAPIRTRPTGSGPTPTSTMPRSSCATSSSIPRRPPSSAGVQPATSDARTAPLRPAPRWRHAYGASTRCSSSVGTAAS